MRKILSAFMILALGAIVSCQQEVSLEDKTIQITEVIKVGENSIIWTATVLESKKEEAINNMRAKITSEMGQELRAGYDPPFFSVCHPGYNCSGWNGPTNCAGFAGGFCQKWTASYFKCESWHVPMAYYGESGNLSYELEEPGGPTPSDINSWNCI